MPSNAYLSDSVPKGSSGAKRLVRHTYLDPVRSGRLYRSEAIIFLQMINENLLSATIEVNILDTSNSYQTGNTSVPLCEQASAN